MLAFMFALALITPLHSQKTILHIQGHSVQVTAENGLQPTLATFVGGERSCPSVASEVQMRSCISKLASEPFSTNAILASCEREAARLGCKKTAGDLLVSVQAIYDITVPGQKPDECMIAKVGLGSQDERFVDMASLLFAPDVKPFGTCYTTPSVRIRTLAPPLGDRLLTRRRIRPRAADTVS